MPLRTHAGVRIWPPPPPPPQPESVAPETAQPEFFFESAPHSLPVPFFEQELTNWCWAACVQMVMHYFDQTDVRQCDVASRFLQVNSCADPDSFDEGRDPEEVETIFNRQSPSISCTPLDDTVPFSTIQSEIDDEERPVAVAVFWFRPNGQQRGGHLLIVKGWGRFDGRNFVKVNDPWYGRGDVSFARLRRYYGPPDDGLNGVWMHTWMEIRR